jgi:hypothetical protein
MTHKRNHLDSEYSRCNKKGKCIYGFPQPIQPETTIDEYGRAKYRRRSEKDAWIASYIPALLKLLRCHVHVDVCFTTNVILYLFKYLYKSPVTTKFDVVEGDAVPRPREADEWQNGRYLSSCEAAWRILRFHITTVRPTVVAISIHLPNQQLGQMFRARGLTSPITKLLIYLHRPVGPHFDDLLLLDFYRHYRVTSIPASQWPLSNLRPGEYQIQVREQGALRYYCIIDRGLKTVITRLKSYPPQTGELFFLRAVLQHKPGRSWNDLYTVDGVLHPSFQAVAIALALFPRDGEAHYAMAEAVELSYSPPQLRFLFVGVLLEFPTDALKLYADFLQHMSWDLQMNHAEDEWEDKLLQILERYLQSRGASLSHFKLPMPTLACSEVTNELTAFKSQAVVMEQEVERMTATFNPEQQDVYHYLKNAIELPDSPQTYFIDGKAGRGKTFLMNCLVMSLRAKGDIVLVAGSTALSIIHYERGRTAHSTFGIPVVEVYISF